MADRLFVYGTLLVADVMEAVTGRRFASRPATLKGFRRLRVRGAGYPGIIRDPASRTDGRLYCGLEARHLERLDRFEGELYERRRVDVEMEGISIGALAYVVRDRCRAQLGTEAWDERPYLQNARIRHARREDADALARTLALAFRDDPFHRWVLPGEEAWAKRSRALFRLLLRQALEHGVVMTNEGLEGVAIWDQPSRPVLPVWKRLGLAARTAWLIGRRSSLVQEAFEQLERARPKEPHWHLSVLGTEPDRHSRGIGSALLASGLERCDREGVVAYLESSKPGNLRFYRRHGFELVGRLPLAQGPTLWPMRREPG